MKVLINDKEYMFDEQEIGFNTMLKKLEIKSGGLIAEVDGKVFNSEEFDALTIKDGSKIELIRVFGGG